MWWRLHHSGLRYTGAKYIYIITLVCVFIVIFPFLSFPFLSFLPFLFLFLPSPTAWTPEPIFMADGSKCVDWCKEAPVVCLNYVRLGGQYPLKTTPQKPQMLKSQPNEWSRITSKRSKIDKKCQCTMNIKSELPFQNPWWKITYGAS